MNCSIRSIMLDFVASQYRVSCSSWLWKNGLGELRKRGNGYRESGAFLLGTICKSKKRITRFVFYDDLEPNCLDTGVIVMSGVGYGALWKTCRDSGLSVIADVHTHPGSAKQSGIDQLNPMIATPGHLSIIIPNYAKKVVSSLEIGLYEYSGNHRWQGISGRQAWLYFYIGLLG